MPSKKSKPLKFDRRLTVTLSHAAADEIADQQIPGEAVSETVSRLIESIAVIERTISRMGGRL